MGTLKLEISLEYQKNVEIILIDSNFHIGLKKPSLRFSVQDTWHSETLTQFLKQLISKFEWFMKCRAFFDILNILLFSGFPHII